jgi:hypothetical protein
MHKEVTVSLTVRHSALVCTLLLTFQCAATPGAEIHFNAPCDFNALTMNIREEQDVNPGYVTLDVKLQSAAQAQLTQLSRGHMNQPLSTYINGTKISTATIRAVLDTENIRFIIDKKTAEKIFHALLATQCRHLKQ